MPRRQRRTRPQNIGQNRNTQMRNNARRGGPSFSPNQRFQGGVGQNPGAPGGQSQQNNMQCPAGQQPGRGPDGRPTCVPARQTGVQGGAGAPRLGNNPKNRQGY